MEESQQPNQVSQPLDITAFDGVSDHNESQPLALLDARDKEIGITLYVLGRHSDVVTKLEAKHHRRTMAALQASMRGRKNEEDDIIDRDVESSCARVTAWEGVKQPFNKELLASALRRNPSWRDQIFEFSNNLGNYGRRPSKIS